GALAESGERLVDLLQRVDGGDRDPQLSAGGQFGGRGEGFGAGVGQDRVDGGALDGVGGEAEGGGEPPVPAQQAREPGHVACQVQHRVHSVGGYLAYSGFQVARVVDDLDRSEPGDEVGLRAGTCGGDHPGASGGGQLHGVRAHAAGGSGDQDGVALADPGGVQAVEGGGAGQPERS